MNMVRGAASGDPEPEKDAPRRAPHDPQNAKPTLLIFPQFAQALSAGPAAGAPPRAPKPIAALPTGGVPVGAGAIAVLLD
jgi:hypothetical protein